MAHAGTNENTTTFCNHPFLDVSVFPVVFLILVRVTSHSRRVGGRNFNPVGGVGGARDAQTVISIVIGMLQ